VRVVIVGAGEVGSNIAAGLADSHDVVVIDKDASLVDELTYDQDVLAMHGDGTDIDVLREAGIAESDMLIASTDVDETNIVVCGTADVLCDAFTIARVKRPQFLRTWENERRAFGVEFMVCTDLLAAENIVGVIGLPTARDVDTFADGLVQMAEFEIPAESPVSNQTVSEADRFAPLTFAAITRGEEIVLPAGETVIEPGDEVIVIGSPDAAREFSTAISPEESRPRDVVIVGGSEIGYQTARLLEKRGFKPRLVEQDPDRARWLAEQLPKTTVLESDATDQAFLERERIGDADLLLATLDSEQQNLLATLLAKRLGVDRTVAVVDTGAFADLFEAVGVDVAVSPREATAEEITRFTHARRTENVSLIDGDRAEVMEIEIDADSPVAGRTIAEAVPDLPDGVVVGAIARGGRLITPAGTRSSNRATTWSSSRTRTSSTASRPRYEGRLAYGRQPRRNRHEGARAPARGLGRRRAPLPRVGGAVPPPRARVAPPRVRARAAPPAGDRHPRGVPHGLRDVARRRPRRGRPVPPRRNGRVRLARRRGLRVDERQYHYRRDGRRVVRRPPPRPAVPATAAPVAGRARRSRARRRSALAARGRGCTADGDRDADPERHEAHVTNLPARIIGGLYVGLTALVVFSVNYHTEFV